MYLKWIYICPGFCAHMEMDWTLTSPVVTGGCSRPLSAVVKALGFASFSRDSWTSRMNLCGSAEAFPTHAMVQGNSLE